MICCSSDSVASYSHSQTSNFRKQIVISNKMITLHKPSYAIGLMYSDQKENSFRIFNYISTLLNARYVEWNCVADEIYITFYEHNIQTSPVTSLLALL